MTTKIVDVIFNTDYNAQGASQTKAGAKGVEDALKKVEQQANRTREKMEKLAQVGNRLALVGGAILAPFALAMKKYVDANKDTEPTARRIVALTQRWEKSQERIGRITAEVVLPYLEKALNVVDKITAFAEAHPDFVKAALGLGAGLVIAGTTMSTVASVVSTLATIQGLLAGAGLIGTAGTAAAGAGGVASIGAAIGPALIAAAPYIATALAVVLAAEMTRQLINYATGQNTTWSDIATTAKQLLFIVGEGWKYALSGQMFKDIGAYIAANMSKDFEALKANIQQGAASLIGNIKNIPTALGNMIRTAFAGFISGVTASLGNLGRSILSGLISIGNYIVSGISKLLSLIPHRAEGGYVGSGMFVGGEKGQEFVMSNATTRAAENIIGGSLSQQRLLQTLAGGSGTKRINYYDSRHIDASLSKGQRDAIKLDVMNALAGAL